VIPRGRADPKVPEGGGRSSWNAVKSAYHAYSGLLWIVPRTPSLQLGVAAVLVVAVIGLALRLPFAEVGVLVLVGTLLLAVEALNTSVEMLCDHLHPQHHPAIGKVKDVAAGATAITEIGGGLAVALILGPHLWGMVSRWL
jgi:diacylglycerol kinase (ATP)